MQSRSARWARVSRSLRARIDSPRRAWLLLRMGGFWVLLAVLRPLLPLKWLVRLATPGEVRQPLPASDVLACSQWLDEVGIWRKPGACLPRALVLRRYLSLAGFDPLLWIGFDGEAGHAWVELDGAVYQEQSGEAFRAALLVRPGRVEVEPVLNDGRR